MEYVSVAKKASLWTPVLPPRIVLRLIWIILESFIETLNRYIIFSQRLVDKCVLSLS